MIEAMIEMGRILLKNSNLITEKIEKLDARTKKGEKRYVVKIDFDLIEEAFKLDLEEIDGHTAEKYLLLGREGGPNNPQWYLTFEKCNNLISQSLPNFVERLEDGELRDKVRCVLEKYYVDFGSAVDKKYRYLLNVCKFAGVPGDLNLLLKEKKQKDAKNAYKNLVSKMSGEFSKHCEKQFECNKGQIGLYTVCIDGQAVVGHPDYLAAVQESFEARLEGKNESALKCSVCGSGDGCTSDLKDMSIKYYTTNQCIFAHKMIQGNYSKNFVLCKECYQSLQGAEKFIEKELKTKVNNYDLYVIPHVIYGAQLDGAKIRKMAEVIQPAMDISRNIDDLGEYRDKVEERLELLNRDGYQFLLNFIFYKRLQQATKIQKMIKDVQPSVFCAIQDALHGAYMVFKTYFSQTVSEQINKKRDLKMIYFMHPIKLKDGGPVQYQKLLWMYEDIFYRKKIHGNAIFSSLAEVFQIVSRQREGYNVSSTKQQYFAFKVIEAMYYIHFLQKYGCLEGGVGMDVNKLGVSGDTKAYICEMGYNEQQTAMFLLGMLVGSIGKKQDSGSDEGTYKPILDKINFMGMDEARIVRLSTDVFNKLKQEKILGKYHNEAIYNDHCNLFGKERNRWKLNKNESLFYLLSGYAYQTMKKKRLEDEDNA